MVCNISWKTIKENNWLSIKKVKNGLGKNAKLHLPIVCLTGEHSHHLL